MCQSKYKCLQRLTSAERPQSEETQNIFHEKERDGVAVIILSKGNKYYHKRQKNNDTLYNYIIT